MINLLIAVLFLHLQRTTPTGPVCSDSATYHSYDHTTKFKGLLNKIPWDLSRNTDQNCNMIDPNPSNQAETCGDCDFDLDVEVWYRFDKGPYSRIAEMPHHDYCPKLGHCNGFGQIALVKNFTQSNDTVFRYHLVLNKGSTYGYDAACSKTPEAVVEGYNCTNFILYKFPDRLLSIPLPEGICQMTWIDLRANCTDGCFVDDWYTPYSLCMEDTIEPQNLTSNGIFYPGSTNDQTPDTPQWEFSCSSSSYPTPPAPGTPSEISWSAGATEEVTSAYNNPFTVTSTTSVHTYNTPTVTCSTQYHTQTFHRVDITTFNGSVEVGRGLSYSCCSFTINGYNDSEVELYLISTSRSWDSGESSVSYHTPANYTAMVTDRQDNKYWIGIDVFSFPSFPSSTKLWSCAVRDNITGSYITGNFKVATLKAGITVVAIMVAVVVVALCVISHVAAMVLMVLLRRRRRTSGG